MRCSVLVHRLEADIAVESANASVTAYIYAPYNTSHEVSSLEFKGLDRVELRLV